MESLINKPALSGIIIAAGESRRLNSPKQLLVWQGGYLINHVIQVALQAELLEVLVVLGSRAEVIQPVIKDKPINIVLNADWADGMSTSIKAGIAALSDETEGVFILLVDQPFVTAALLNRMIERFSQTTADILAPRVGPQQCNPVLFNNSLFPELLKISGDKGAKLLLTRHTVEWVDWDNPNLPLDIDSEEDYRIALERVSS